MEIKLNQRRLEEAVEEALVGGEAVTIKARYSMVS
jgi:hypothetical protein